MNSKHSVKALAWHERDNKDQREWRVIKQGPAQVGVCESQEPDLDYSCRVKWKAKKKKNILRNSILTAACIGTQERQAEVV